MVIRRGAERIDLAGMRKARLGNLVDDDWRRKGRVATRRETWCLFRLCFDSQRAWRGTLTREPEPRAVEFVNVRAEVHQAGTSLHCGTQSPARFRNG